MSKDYLKIRLEIEALKSSIAALESRPADADTIAEAVRAACRAQAAELEESIEEAAGWIAADPSNARAIFNGARSSSAGAWASKMLRGLLADQLAERLTARACAIATAGGNPIKPAERAEQLLNLRRKLYQAELDDVLASLTAGVALRTETNPAAALGAPLAAAEAAALI